MKELIGNTLYKFDLRDINVARKLFFEIVDWCCSNISFCVHFWIRNKNHAHLI